MEHLAVNKLRQETAHLAREVERLNNHRFVQVQNQLWRLMLWQFLRGMAFGFGSVVGATLLVSFIVYWLSQIEFVPILGDWATAIIGEIEAVQAGESSTAP